MVTGGAARAQFDATAPFAIPDIATLRPSSGSFTGDFVAAGIESIGFRFRSETHLPSSLYIELAGSTSVFQRVFAPGAPGQWHYYMASLDSAEAGGWTVKKGSLSDFDLAVRDVKSVAIKIRRSGATAREFAIDDLFDGALPRGGGASLDAGGTATLAWDALQVGAPYTVQRSASLGGPWTDTDVLVATGRLHRIPLVPDAGAPHRFYRLRGP